MPTYEYECKSCGYTFDAFQGINESPLKACPQCGKDVRRLINGGMGVIFKGPGFYVTDKKGGGGSSSSKGASKPEPAASSAEAQKGRSSPSQPSPCPSCAKAETSSCPKAANG
jgi:putative FmdB family regulatory protein